MGQTKARESLSMPNTANQRQIEEVGDKPLDNLDIEYDENEKTSAFRFQGKGRTGRSFQ